MKMKAIASLSSFFLVMSSCIFMEEKRSTASDADELDCNNNPLYKHLEVSTDIEENSDVFNAIIITGCQVDLKWRVKDDILQQCEIPTRVFEGEDKVRRPFRFTYIKSPHAKEKIEIKTIRLEYPKDVADSVLSKTGFELYPGDFYEVFVEYDCLDIRNVKKKVDKNWYILRFVIEFENGAKLSFEYIKICKASYSDTLDLSNLIIIGLIFLIIYTSALDHFQSKLENAIVAQFPEIKNPENLIIISFVTIVILIFLYVIDILGHWVHFCIFFLSPFSIAMILEAILDKTELKAHLDSKTFDIPYFGYTITLLFILGLGLGYIILIIWLLTHNWLINNILAISLSIITIRVIKLTSFKFILSTYIIAFIYDYLWVIFKAKYYGENYRLTNLISHHIPIRILCPELVTSPFSACNSLPIADIILPGILLVYCKRFDEKKKIIENRAYFHVGVIALSFGLAASMFVYYVKMIPTPSFLFTGPFILIGTLLVAYQNEHLYDFIEGFKSTEYVESRNQNALRRTERNVREISQTGKREMYELSNIYTEVREKESRRISQDESNISY